MQKTQKNTLKSRLQYHFDNLMTGGLLPTMIMLLIWSLLITLFFGLIVWVTGVEEEGAINGSFIESLWQSFTHLIDQGTLTGDANWGFRIVMFFMTLLGLLTVSTLVGLITSSINTTLENLRKGRSIVLESNHIVILGWSAKIFSIIEKLIISNRNPNKKVHIAILANRDKIMMEDAIREKIPKELRSKAKIISRTGNPIDLNDLEIISPHEAQAIISLPPDDQSSDAYIIKCVIALVNNPNRKNHLYHIIAELHNEDNEDITKIIGGDELTMVVSDDLTARVAVQTCLQSGLSVVYNQILNFERMQIYFADRPDIYGKKFEDALFAYEDATVIGIFRVKTGILLLNPPLSRKIRETDQLVMIAKNDKKLTPFSSGITDIPEKLKANGEINELQPKRTLILGANHGLPIIIEEMNNYLPKGSEVVIMADEITEIGMAITELVEDLTNITVNIKQGNTTDRRTLTDLDVETFDHLMILSYSDKLDIQEADAVTLVTLMHLRQLKEQKSAQFTIVSEMMDIKNRILAEIAKPDDFIISEHIISLLLAQLARNRELSLVFDEIFDSKGSEVYMKPAHFYINCEAEPEVDFYTLVKAASERGEVAIGYRINEKSGDITQDYGIVVNPSKSAKFKISEVDKVIVIAKD